MKRLTLFLATVAVVATFAPASRADRFTTFLSGPAEAPPNSSPGTGFALVDFDTTLHKMRVNVTFSGLLGTTTASHIHASTAQPFTGTAGVATQTPSFTGFPTGVRSGTYDHTFDMTLSSSYNAPFITANGGTTAGAEAALFTAISTGHAYLNIHTGGPIGFPGGEIRGFLVQAVAPEPASASLLAVAGIAGLALIRRRK